MMTSGAIEESIGFAELKSAVISALRLWIRQRLMQLREENWMDAEEALAAPTKHSGSGSILFHAITLRSTGLVRLSLLHLDVKDIVNGTNDSWPPFAKRLTMRLCDITDELMEHPAFNFSAGHWQMMII